MRPRGSICDVLAKTRRPTAFAIALAAGLLVSAPASAQSVATLVGRKRPPARAWVDAGWDPTFVVGLGLSSRVWSRPGTTADIDLGLFVPPVVTPSSASLMTTVGVTATHVRASGLGVALGLHPDVRSAEDSVARSLALGSTLTLRPGYYAPRATAALDLGYALTWATIVRPRAPVVDLFRDRYPDARAGDGGGAGGVFALASHRLRLGVTGGAAFSPRFALHGGLGFAWTPQRAGLVNPPYGPLPFYVSLGGSYRW